jgi:hypothetical protein
MAHQTLALAVIAQAVADARRSSGKLREDARRFLTTRETLAQWSGTLGVAPAFVEDVVRKALAAAPAVAGAEGCHRRG